VQLGLDRDILPVGGADKDLAAATLDNVRNFHYLRNSDKTATMPTSFAQSSTITAKGQTTIPKAVRDALGLNSGDRISFEIGADGVSVNKMEEEQDPVALAFLDFLARDMQANPDKIRPFSSGLLQRAAALTRDMVVDVDEELVGKVAL
jgi:antitoxin PrlF